MTILEWVKILAMIKSIFPGPFITENQGSSVTWTHPHMRPLPPIRINKLHVKLSTHKNNVKRFFLVSCFPQMSTLVAFMMDAVLFSPKRSLSNCSLRVVTSDHAALPENSARASVALSRGQRYRAMSLIGLFPVWWRGGLSFSAPQGRHPTPLSGMLLLIMLYYSRMVLKQVLCCHCRHCDTSVIGL